MAPSVDTDLTISTPNGNDVQVKKRTSFWDPNEEKAACGVGFIVNIYGNATNQVMLRIFYPKITN